jgi:uncharacterized membrane protein YcaP (DUF421 family)
MDLSWITTSWTAILMIILSSIGIYIALIAFTRIAGLRSFSKMSSFDFAITVSFGSIIANTVTAKSPPLLLGAVSLGSLYILQIIVARFRGNSTIMSKMVDNDPLLLMDGPEILYDNLKMAEVTEDDLRAKLREANVIQMDQVKAVVMEATGDVSVLHEGGDLALEAVLLKNVKR